VAHYLIHRSLDEQAAAAKLGPSAAAADAAALPAESGASDASAQTAGGDAVCDEHEATTDCAAAEAVAGGVHVLTEGNKLQVNALVQRGLGRRLAPITSQSPRQKALSCNVCGFPQAVAHQWSAICTNKRSTC